MSSGRFQNVGFFIGKFGFPDKWSRKASGANYMALTRKRLVFWIGGHLWEIVTYERSVTHDGCSPVSTKQTLLKRLQYKNLCLSRYTAILNKVLAKRLGVGLRFCSVVSQLVAKKPSKLLLDGTVKIRV